MFQGVPLVSPYSLIPGFLIKECKNAGKKHMRKIPKVRRSLFKRKLNARIEVRNI